MWKFLMFEICFFESMIKIVRMIDRNRVLMIIRLFFFCVIESLGYAY